MVGWSEGPSSTASADGTPLYVGTRVQTQWTREEGGDDRWYAGSVSAVLASGEGTIKYDDGDEWTGSAMDVHLLNSAHPLKSGSCVEQIWDTVFKILGRTFGMPCACELVGATPCDDHRDPLSGVCFRRQAHRRDRALV